jgi:hypothetical protein
MAGGMNIFVVGGATVKRTDKDFSRQVSALDSPMKAVGRGIIERGHNLLVCSPFSGSADLPAVLGAVESAKLGDIRTPRILYHHPNTPETIQKWRELSVNLACPAIQPFRHDALLDEAGNPGEYGWLLAQLSALDQCHAVVTIGGKTGLTASMLLALAIERQKPILPIPYQGGAAARCYDRLEKQLEKYLGEELAFVHDPQKVDDIVPLALRLAAKQILPGQLGRKPAFFISYPRCRPSEADVVERLLLRLQHDVFRDDKDFPPGAPLQDEIKAKIHQSTVFIALWCQEYACSPWCFDELQEALPLAEEKHLQLWILCLDCTRIVPKNARRLLTFPVNGRKELEGAILDLLSGQRQPGRHNSEPDLK